MKICDRKTKWTLNSPGPHARIPPSLIRGYARMCEPRQWTLLALNQWSVTNKVVSHHRAIASSAMLEAQLLLE